MADDVSPVTKSLAVACWIASGYCTHADKDRTGRKRAKPSARTVEKEGTRNQYILHSH